MRASDDEVMGLRCFRWPPVSVNEFAARAACSKSSSTIAPPNFARIMYRRPRVGAGHTLARSGMGMS